MSEFWKNRKNRGKEERWWQLQRDEKIVSAFWRTDCGLPPCPYNHGVLANLADLCRNRLGSHKPLDWCEIYDLKVFMKEYNQSRGEGSIAWCLDEDYGETIWQSSLSYIRGPFVSSASFAIFSHLSLSFMDFSFQKSVVFDCLWKFFCHMHAFDLSLVYLLCSV